MSSWVLGSFCLEILHIELCNYDFQVLFFKIQSNNALSRNIFDETFKILHINHIWLKFLYSYIQYLTLKSYSRAIKCMHPQSLTSMHAFHKYACIPQSLTSILKNCFRSN